MTSTGNHSLNDLTNTVPGAATVYADILLTGSGSTFTGSDHYPIVGDYSVVVPPPATPAAPVLTALSYGADGTFQFELSSTTNTVFGIQASTNLANWVSIGSGTTDISGLLHFQDTNAAGFPSRFYRAHWPSP